MAPVSGYLSIFLFGVRLKVSLTSAKDRNF